MEIILQKIANGFPNLNIVQRHIVTLEGGGTAMIKSYHAADTGVGGLAVDLYTPDRAQALQNGRQALAVWFFPPAGEEAESCT